MRHIAHQNFQPTSLSSDDYDEADNIASPVIAAELARLRQTYVNELRIARLRSNAEAVEIARRHALARAVTSMNKPRSLGGKADICLTTVSLRNERRWMYLVLARLAILYPDMARHKAWNIALRTLARRVDNERVEIWCDLADTDEFRISLAIAALSDIKKEAETTGGVTAMADCIPSAGNTIAPAHSDFTPLYSKAFAAFALPPFKPFATIAAPVLQHEIARACD